MANAALSAHIHALHDPDLRIRIEAGSALVAIGQPAVDPLSASLFNVPPEARWRALAAIGWIGDHQAIEALLTALKDDVSEVAAGTECGVLLADTNDIKPGDNLEIFETEERARTL